MRPRIAVDTENTGLRPFQGDVNIMASFADETGAWSLPPGEACALIREKVAAGYEIIMHNSPYDRAVFRANWGIEVPDGQVYDTLAVDWLLDENADHRLKEGLGVRILGIDATEEAKALKAIRDGVTVDETYRAMRAVENEKPRAERERADATRERARAAAAASKKGWENLTIEDYQSTGYAEQDAHITWVARHWQEEELEGAGAYVKPDVQRQFDIGSMSYRIQRTGIRVDQGKAEQELEKAQAHLAELAEPFEGINLRSSKQMAKLIYEDWGLPVQYKQLRGGVQGPVTTNKDALAALAYDDRVATLIEFRRFAKQVDAYYFPLLDRTSADGRLHPALNPWRTVTGRFSSSGPNLQTIPRESTASEIRKVFIPAPGLVLTEWDLSQIEIRIAADMSQEPALLQVYEEGGDIYQAVADALGVSRDWGKKVVLSAQYGAGPRKMALDLAHGTGRPPELALGRRVFNLYWNTYPKVDRLMKGLDQRARERGFVAHWRPGRRRLFDSPYLPYPRYYTALNALIQGGAAEMLKDVLLALEPEVERRGWGQVVLTVHDSIVIEHEPGADALISPLLAEITEDVKPYKIATPWEAKLWR